MVVCSPSSALCAPSWEILCCPGACNHIDLNIIIHSDAWICDAKFFCELFCYLLQYIQNYNLNKSELTPFFSHESFAILMSDWMPHVTDNLSLHAAYLPLMLWNFPESIKTDQKLLTARVKEAQAPLLLATHPPPSSRP